MYQYDEIVLKKVPQPRTDHPEHPVPLRDETIAERMEKVRSRMIHAGLDCLIVYADLEHGSNFEYLVGFLPRFEEALLVLHSDGRAYLVLGNENLNKASKARIPCIPVHAPYFSLPNQPMENTGSFTDILRKTDIAGKKTGLAGWKLFTSKFEDNTKLFDLPHYITEAVFTICGKENVTNACDIFIGRDGARNTNNPNEIAHYEFGASLAGDCMLDAMNALKPGISEMETADRLNRYGQRNSVVTIAAFGERFIKANMYPTCRKLQIGDTVSLTVGYKGGLSSRAGYAVKGPEELSAAIRAYTDVLVKPYFTAIRAMLEKIHTGMTGSELYALINEVLPRNTYNWKLNPGHLTADEEWSMSPVYENSDTVLSSGMLFQTDIIPGLPGYGGVSAESTFALADNALQERIKAEYPDLWQRFEERRLYIRETLGIQLSDEVLPMCSTLAYLRPYLLCDEAMTVTQK